MKKYLAALVCGFGAGVLQVVPFAKSFGCCIIIPAAVYLSILLHIKANKLTGKFSTSTGALLGLLTGLYAAFFGTTFDILITFITRSNEIIDSFVDIQNMMQSFPLDQALKEEVLNLVSNVAEEIRTTGFSFFYSLSILINNLIVNSIFGLFGGLVGSAIFNSRLKNQL